MTAVKLAALVAASTVLGVSSYAQTAAGSWRGHVELPAPSNLAGLSEMQKLRSQQYAEGYKHMIVMIELKADGNYVLSTVGGPPTVSNKPRKGTWSQTGRTITLQFPVDPRAKVKAPDMRPMQGTVSADDKHLEVLVEGSVHVSLARVQ